MRLLQTCDILGITEMLQATVLPFSLTLGGSCGAQQASNTIPAKMNTNVSLNSFIHNSYKENTKSYRCYLMQQKGTAEIRQYQICMFTFSLLLFISSELYLCPHLTLFSFISLFIYCSSHLSLFPFSSLSSQLPLCSFTSHLGFSSQ